MAVDRLERINSLLKRVIAESIHVVMQGDPVKPGLFTVTSVACGKDLRDATVKVSVFGDDSVKHLSRNARRFQEIINREIRLKFTPRLTFQLDKSLEKGDAVLSIIDRIERLNEAQPPTEKESSQPAE